MSRPSMAPVCRDRAAAPFPNLLRTGLAAAVLLAASVDAVGQEDARWFARVGAPGMRIVGPTGLVRQKPPGPITTAPGDFAVHFPRDAAGKPESLRFVVPEGAEVAVAVEPAGFVERKALAEIGRTNYVVASAVSVLSSVGQVGLVARRTDDDNWYRFVWDCEREQLRLERSIGGSVIVINAASGPPCDDVVHALALQVEGFRLRAFFDEALVLQALDGAHVEGDWKEWQSTGVRAGWIDTVVEPPAAPRPSSALIRSGDSAVFVGATAAAGGTNYVLELALDRPHPLVPLTDAGLELWLLQRPAQPRVLLGDFLGALGRDTIGELPIDGRIRSGLKWPVGAALAHQAALVRALLVTPDGDHIAGRTPPVPVEL